MNSDKIYLYFRKLVTALVLLFTFILPLKLGSIIGIPESASFFTKEIGAYLFISWPIFTFPLISGSLLILALLAFPFKTVSLTEDKGLICASLWILVAFSSLLGIINATVWDFVIMEIVHLFGIAAYALTVYLFLKHADNAKSMLTAAIIAGLAVSIIIGFEQYFSGFDQMREYIENQEKSTGVAIHGDMKARIFDDRLYAPFTGSNSLAGYILLTAPLCLVILWKLCARVEPPKIARMIFIPTVAACLFFIFFATKARGAFLSVILACGVLTIFFPVKKWLRLAIVILAPIVVLGGAVYIYKYGRGFDSMKVRIDYIWVSLKLLLKHPFAGTGWGDFFYDYMRLKAIQSKEAPHTPHNLFMAMGGQAGIIALATSIGAMFYPLWLGARKVRSLLANHMYMEEDVAIVFGLTAFTFHTMMDIDLQVPGLLATAVALMLLLTIPSKSEDKIVKKKPFLKFTTFLISFLIAALAVCGSWHLLSSEYIFSKLDDICKLSGKTPDDILRISPYEVNKRFRKAVKARPYSPFPYSKAGSFYMATGRMESAESSYRKALEISPDCAAYYFRLFIIQDFNGNHEQAKENLLKANELFPNNPKYKLAKEAFFKK